MAIFKAFVISNVVEKPLGSTELNLIIRGNRIMRCLNRTTFRHDRNFMIDFGLY